MFLHGNSRINQRGHLEIGGCDTVELAREFGTPLIIYDEEHIRSQCRTFIQACKSEGIPFQIAYASKAFCSIGMVQLIAEEGLSIDVVSGGELYTAIQAGFPPERIHFHGNNKSLEELKMALEEKIGCIVVDNFYEIALLSELCRERNQEVNVLLRITPGVHASTHKYIQTGQEDSKFGFDLASGQVDEAIKQVRAIPHFNFLGLHTHIGSQIFGSEGFIAAIDKIADYIENLDVPIKVLNLGGGFGIRYNEEHNPSPIESVVKEILRWVKKRFAEKSISLPEIWFEPGRSIVGEAGTTLYRLGAIKRLPGLRTYVSVDGGMSDNIRPALYQASHEAILANRALEPVNERYSIAGKLCESGDMLIWDIDLPTVHPNDLLAVSCTGAYGYSMASNYNRIPRPAVIFVRNGEARLIIQRETYEDLIRNDVKRIPQLIR